MIRAIFLTLFMMFGAVLESGAQTADMIRLPALQTLIEANTGKIKVINFWATWCAPCVKELPLFEKLNQERSDVKVMLVSMDIDLDPNPEKVRKFIVRKKMLASVYILDEQNPDGWINKIEKSWSGALPATLIINDANGKRQFVEKELHPGDLEKIIASLK